MEIGYELSLVVLKAIFDTQVIVFLNTNTLQI
jgi:hypothetical protein